MHTLLLQALLLLALAVGGVYVVARTTRWQRIIHRRHFAIFGVVSTLAFLGLVPGFARVIAKVQAPTTEFAAWMLTLGLIAVAVCAGMLFAGRTELAKLGRGIVGRARIWLEEFRNPDLKARNACIRRYDRAVGLMAKPVEGRPEKVRRHRLASIIIFRDLTDADIATLADYSNALLLDGKGDVRQLARFFEEERRIADEEPTEVSLHGIRLTRLISAMRPREAV